jgi:large subunit ribosomal protein L21
MYAVIRSGGKQYRVAPDDVIQVEKLDAAPGASIVLDEVLMVGGGSGAGAKVGSPLVAGAAVSAEVVDQKRGPKIIVFKKKRRKNYRRRNGHRQDLTLLRITGIDAGA